MAMEDEGSEVGEKVDQLQGEADATAKFVNKFIAQNRGKVKNWQSEARVAYRVVMGDLWDDNDKAKLRSEDRPTPDINFGKKYIDVTSGTEMLNPLEVRFLARVPDNTTAQMASEQMTGIYSSIMDNCRGYFGNSRVFKDQLTAGMGWCGERLDLTREASGEALVEWIDNMEMIWDTNAVQDNLRDMRMLVRLRTMPKDAAIDEWPDEEAEIKKYAHSGQTNPLDDPEKDRHVVPLKYDPLNALEKSGGGDNRPKNFVTIKEAYWFVIEKWHEFIDPFTHQMTELPTKKFKEFVKTFNEEYPDIEIESFSSKRRVYKRAFVIGGHTLEEGDSPMKDHFPYQCCTGDWDKHTKIWRGLLFTLMEPEKYATKMFSVGLHILATSQKGGMFYEPDTFVNQKQAEDEWARPDPFIAVTEGAIAAQRFQVRDPQPPPEGIFRIWSSCVDMIQQVTGINIDVLGSATGEVPVGTTQRRMMQGVASIAGYFNSYRLFMLDQAEAMLEYIRDFYTDDRAIRIGGAFDSQVVQLTHDDAFYHYDLKIDLNPMNPDAKAAAWEAMSPILPVLVKTGGIFAVPSIMDYAPIPAKLSVEIKQYLKGMAQAQQQGGDQKEEKGKKEMPPELVAANVRLKTEQANLTRMKARQIDQQTALDRASAGMEGFTAMHTHRRAQQAHQMDMLSKTHQIDRENQGAAMDRIANLSDMMNKMRAQQQSEQSASED